MCLAYGAYLHRSTPAMPVRFRTVKLASYAIRRSGGSIERHPDKIPTYTLQLPDSEPQGPFTRDQLLSWANQHLP